MQACSNDVPLSAPGHDLMKRLLGKQLSAGEALNHDWFKPTGTEEP